MLMTRASLLASLAALGLCLGACRDKDDAPAATTGTETSAETTPQAEEPAQDPATAEDSAAAGDTEAAAEDGAEDAADAGSAQAEAPAAAALAGRDFIEEARMLYRAVACAGDAPLAAHLDAQVVAAHCKKLNQRKQRYGERYATGAKEFLATLRPEGLPDVVVYPFGGGDLISALVAYPDAREITTMSLEHGGDPRRIRDIDGAALAESLEAFRAEIGGMLEVSNNTSKNLSAAHVNLLPAQLSSFLVGLAAHGFEPVSVRYFTLAEDGSVQYLDDAAIAKLEDEDAKRLKYDWEPPNFSAAFSNVETRFRPLGGDASAPVRVHRHFAANLADVHLPKDGPLYRHLESKGRVSAMTKAASYLLWRNEFSNIRDYLLEHMEFMISDSTGIPPRYARRAGFVQIPLGRYESAFLPAPETHDADFLALWTEKPYRRVPFRFGYVDSAKQRHLLITKRAPAKE
ncbi:hypothetical protein [Haliangium ochraceum]|uniref:Lipoprotein n=1 Tax=Haliangium ochraceum (strain DSM 14365 / JCM 11303 / SMP-2) TaxID=502025 RepID=D0LW85_HALO1|nr:hypothetical protein [Haliangium ochraceum]ACY16017.1 conserved hypothetical protein [Haliangium ochraceum DSM 14365]